MQDKGVLTALDTLISYPLEAILGLIETIIGYPLAVLTSLLSSTP